MLRTLLIYIPRHVTHPRLFFWCCENMQIEWKERRSRSSLPPSSTQCRNDMPTDGLGRGCGSVIENILQHRTRYPFGRGISEETKKRFNSLNIFVMAKLAWLSCMYDCQHFIPLSNITQNQQAAYARENMSRAFKIETTNKCLSFNWPRVMTTNALPSTCTNDPLNVTCFLAI